MNTWTPAATDTLDNWGHKTPTQSKRKRAGKKGLKGHGPKHVYNTLGYIETAGNRSKTNKPKDSIQDPNSGKPIIVRARANQESESGGLFPDVV